MVSRSPLMSLNFLPCLLLSVLFPIPTPLQSIHAPDLLQAIRKLSTLTLLMLSSVEIKGINKGVLA